MVVGALILALLAYRAADKIRKKRVPPSPENTTQTAAAPKTPDTPASAAVPAADASAGQRLDILLAEWKVLEGELKQTREDLEKQWGSPVAENKTYRPLSRNPFLEPRKPAVEPPSPSVAKPKTTPRATRDDTRRNRIATLHLQATSEAAGSSLAIVNGRILRVGDTIEGFRVRKIGNRKITVEDKTGTVVIEMEGIPEL